MVLHWEVSLWNIIGLLAGGLFLISVGISIGVVFRETFAKDIHPDEEHKYYPQQKVDNKNR